MAVNNFELTLRGKKVKVSNNHIYVNGRDTRMRISENSTTRYISSSGSILKHLEGKKLEDALAIEGFI